MNKDELKAALDEIAETIRLYDGKIMPDLMDQESWSHIHKAASEYLSLLDDIQALVEARKDAAEGCGEGNWYTDHHPNDSGTALIDDGLRHGMFAIEAEWPEARFITTAANIISKWRV